MKNKLSYLGATLQFAEFEETLNTLMPPDRACDDPVEPSAVHTQSDVYDGEGQRVRKLVGENLRFVYGIGGQLIAEFSGASGSLVKEYLYGASGLIATIEPTVVNANGTRYTTPDHLGSPRVITNAGASVISRHDYMPFGEELGAGVGGRTTAMGFPGPPDGLRQKFTSTSAILKAGLTLRTLASTPAITDDSHQPIH